MYFIVFKSCCFLLMEFFWKQILEKEDFNIWQYKLFSLLDIFVKCILL